MGVTWVARSGLVAFFCRSAKFDAPRTMQVTTGSVESMPRLIRIQINQDSL